MSSTRIPASAAKKVANVAEVCNVGKEDAYRILQQVHMDEEVAVEKFLTGKVDVWHEVGDKKRRPGSQTKNNNNNRSVPLTGGAPRKVQQGRGVPNTEGAQVRQQNSRASSAAAEPDSKIKPRRPGPSRPKGGSKSWKPFPERKANASARNGERSKQTAAKEEADNAPAPTKAAGLAPPKPAGPTWADRLKAKKVQEVTAPTENNQPVDAGANSSLEPSTAPTGSSLESHKAQYTASSSAVATSAETGAETVSHGRMVSTESRANAPPVSNMPAIEKHYPNEEHHLSMSFSNMAVNGQPLPNQSLDSTESGVAQGSRPLEPSRQVPYDGAERLPSGLQPPATISAAQSKSLQVESNAKLSTPESWSMAPNPNAVRSQPRENARLENQQSGSETAANTSNENNSGQTYSAPAEHIQSPQHYPAQVNGVPPNYYGYYPYGVPGHVPNYGLQGYPYYQPYGGYTDTAYPPKAAPNMTNQNLSYAAGPGEPKLSTMPHAQPASMGSSGAAPTHSTGYNQTELYYGSGAYPQQYAAAYGISSGGLGVGVPNEQTRSVRRNRNPDFYPASGSMSVGGNYGSGFGSFYGTSHQAAASQPYGGMMYNAQGYGNQSFGGSGYTGQAFAGQPYATQPYGSQQYPVWQGQRAAGGGMQSPFNTGGTGNVPGALPGQASGTYPSY